jgi:hypothetical protein
MNLVRHAARACSGISLALAVEGRGQVRDVGTTALSLVWTSVCVTTSPTSLCCWSVNNGELGLMFDKPSIFIRFHYIDVKLICASRKKLFSYSLMLISITCSFLNAVRIFRIIVIHSYQSHAASKFSRWRCVCRARYMYNILN